MVQLNRIVFFLILNSFFLGEVMAGDKINELLNGLRQVSSSLNKKCKPFKSESLKIGIELPSEIHCFFNDNEVLTKQKSEVYFWGQDKFSFDEAINQYLKKSAVDGLYQDFDVDDSFLLPEDMHIRLFSDIDNGIQDDIDISIISGFFPLLMLDGVGDYVVYGVGTKKYPSGIYLFQPEGFATYLAPSLLAHTNNLIEGFSQGVYKVDDGDLVYPFSWGDRIKLMKGEIRMDSYGEIIEE